MLTIASLLPSSNRVKELEGGQSRLEIVADEVKEAIEHDLVGNLCE